MKKGILIVLSLILITSFSIIGCSSTETATVTATQSSTQTMTQTATATTTTTAHSTSTATVTATETIVDRYGGILKLVPYNSPTTPLGYPAESDPNSLELAEPCLESLVAVKDTIEGVLATSWTFANDLSSITMKLREGVKFHDGSDFNADVAKWNLDILTEANKTPQISSVDVIDPYTIRINLVSWDNSVLTNFERNTKMISKESFDKNGLEYTRNHPVGTGPFQFVSYERDVKLVYEKNPNYWVAGKPYMDGIQYDVVPDITVRKILFETGDLHVFRATGTDAQDLLGKDYPYITIAGGTFVLIPDSANPDSPLANLKVRQAISHAINREVIANSLGFGLAHPAYQLYPGFPVAQIPDLEKDTYDIEKAQQLLTEAGYGDGFSMTIHRFIMVPEDFLNAIASMLSEINITVTVDPFDPGRYTDLRFNGWDDGMMGHGMASGQNLNEWINLYLNRDQFPSMERAEGFSEALKASQQATTIDPAKLQAVIKLIAEDEMVIPYAEEVAITFLQVGIHDSGILKYSLDTWTPESCWLDPDLR